MAFEQSKKSDFADNWPIYLPQPIRRRLLWRRYPAGTNVPPAHWQKATFGLVGRGEVKVLKKSKTGGRFVELFQSGQLVNCSHWDRQTPPWTIHVTQNSTIGWFALSRNLEGVDRPKPGRLWWGIGLLLGVVALAFTVWLWPVSFQTITGNLAYAMASYQLQTGQTERAIIWLERSVNLNPNQARAYNDRGYLYYQAGQTVKALAAFEQALQADPDFGVAHNNLGSLYLDQGKLTQARNQFQQAIALNPANASAWLNLGIASQIQGRFEEAKQAYYAVLRLQPNQAAAQINLGLLYYTQNQPTEAQNHLEIGLSQRPKQPQVSAILSLVLLEQGDSEGAWQILEALESELADDPAYHFYWALWYEKGQIWDQAQAELQTALALNPSRVLRDLIHSHIAVLETTNLSQ